MFLLIRDVCVRVCVCLMNLLDIFASIEGHTKINVYFGNCEGE